MLGKAMGRFANDKIVHVDPAKAGPEMERQLEGLGLLAKRDVDPLASRSTGMYNPPSKPQRPFEEDYPKEFLDRVQPGAKPGDRLTHDIDGRPINPDAWVVGRQVVGGDDVAFPQAQLNALTEKVTGGVPQAQPSSAFRGSDDIGVTHFDAVTGRPTGIGLLDSLTPEQAAMVLEHELGHGISGLAAIAKRPMNGDPGNIPVDGLMKELRGRRWKDEQGIERGGVYDALNNGNRQYKGGDAALSRRLQGVETANSAINARDQPWNQLLEIEGQRYSIPATRVSDIMQQLIATGQLGGSGTSNTQTFKSGTSTEGWADTLGKVTDSVGKIAGTGSAMKWW